MVTMVTMVMVHVGLMVVTVVMVAVSVVMLAVSMVTMNQVLSVVVDHVGIVPKVSSCTIVAVMSFLQ